MTITSKELEKKLEPVRKLESNITFQFSAIARLNCLSCFLAVAVTQAVEYVVVVALFQGRLSHRTGD